MEGTNRVTTHSSEVIHVLIAHLDHVAELLCTATPSGNKTVE